MAKQTPKKTPKKTLMKTPKKTPRKTSSKITNLKKATKKANEVTKNVNNIFSRSRKYKRKSRLQAVALALCFVVVSIGLFFYYDKQTYFFTDWYYSQFNTVEANGVLADGELKVHFVDVGQGDSAIIQFPDGKNMIIDGGPRSSKAKILAYIEALGIEKFDYLMLTHTDEDHVGSLTEVIKATDCEIMFVPNIPTTIITTTVYKNFLLAVEDELSLLENAERVYTVAGDGIIGDTYRIDFITPTADKYSLPNSPTAEQKNSVSPIMILNFNGIKVMFTGDANEKYTEKWFIESVTKQIDYKKNYDVDILKVGHHGSATSSSSEFLDIVQPEYAIISVGKNNKYGHPTASALARLEGVGCEIYRTDLSGDIVLSIRLDEFDFSIQKAA